MPKDLVIIRCKLTGSEHGSEGAKASIIPCSDR